MQLQARAALIEIEATENAECYAQGCQIDAGDIAHREPGPDGAIYCKDHGDAINNNEYEVDDVEDTRYPEEF